jgi:RING finger protein 113A
MASTGDTLNVPFFKKKKGARPTTARKRSLSPERGEGPNAGSSKTQVVLPNRKATSNLLSAGTKRTASQRDGLDDAPEKDGPDVKWSAEGSHTNAALEILAGDEAEELLAKRRRKEQKDAGEDDIEIPDDGQYRGQNAYRTLIKKNTETPKAMRVGPQRGTSTIRTVTITDYQPDVCKDYKGMFRLLVHSSLFWN